MNSFKLLVVFILLLLGSFAQRFQRHSINATRNGYINGNTEMDNLDNLAFDGQNYEQHDADVKFVRDGGEVELESEHKELKFRFCSDGCMGETVTVCYHAKNPDGSLKGSCASNQCEFKAGVSSEYGTTFLWFVTTGFRSTFTGTQHICEDATLKSPKAVVTFLTPEQVFTSCEPLFNDEKVIKLTVTGAKHNCPVFVTNAKKWIPPPTTTAQNSSDLSETNQTTLKSSEANTTLWIGIGVGIFILLIVIFGFGYCCYRTQIQKKPLFGKPKNVQQKAFIPEAPKMANVVKEKTADEKEVVAKLQPSKESTKEETIVTKEKQPKPTKKKASKENKTIVEAKLSKEITQENVTKEDAPEAQKFSTESTLQDLTTEASVVQKSSFQQKQLRNPPRVYVPKKVILPAMNSDGFKSVSLLDTLSGAENDETQHSTHASEKPCKNESAGRKKCSKKHR